MPSSNGPLVPVIVGLVVGIAIIATFSNVFQNSVKSGSPGRSPIISIVNVPENASSTGGNRYEPKVITVIIGMNNTVRWINYDSTIHSVYADNEDDPLFYNATKEQCENNDYVNCTLISGNNTLFPGSSFEFTFTKPGVFGYHSVPHPDMRGAVIVYPKNWRGQ